ncbi:hypothetical protein D3C72_1809850 [compost metagenome]
MGVDRGCAALDRPDLIGGLVGGVEQLLEGIAAQRPHHEEVAVGITEIQRGQFRVVAQRLGQGFQQRQARLQIARLGGAVQDQQTEQVADRLVGVEEILLHILLDAFEQLGAAGDDDLGVLPVVEQPQHHAGEQQQQGE